jgi:hypothetical protein
MHLRLRIRANKPRHRFRQILASFFPPSKPLSEQAKALSPILGSFESGSHIQKGVPHLAFSNSLLKSQISLSMKFALPARAELAEWRGVFTLAFRPCGFNASFSIF